MRRRTRSSLVKIMACRLFGAKPLFKPMMISHQWDPKEQTSMKNIETDQFSLIEFHFCNFTAILSITRVAITHYRTEWLSLEEFSNALAWTNAIFRVLIQISPKFVLKAPIDSSQPLASVIMAWRHYSDVIMGTMASQITSLTIVYSTVYSGTDHRKHQGSVSLTFVRGIHRWPVNSPHNRRPVTRKIFPTSSSLKMHQAISRADNTHVTHSASTYTCVTGTFPKSRKTSYD